jgi:hypothetical protein
VGQENRGRRTENYIETHFGGVRCDGPSAKRRVCLCSEPGSVGDLVVDRDDLKRKVRGLLHSKCKAFLALGCDHPLRFQMAIAYLERMSGQR